MEAGIFAMGFDSNLIPLILNGSKTYTYRVGEQYKYLKVGNIIAFRDSSTNLIKGKIKIKERLLIPFKDLPLEAYGHIYHTKEEQKKRFEQIKGSKLQKDEEILVLGFQLL